MSEKKLFFLNGKRAMISLGPLTNNQHCPFRCAFCYVQDGFNTYASLNEDEIMSFLHKNRDKYNIVYVSGDTDSFAPPRTERALALLKHIVDELDVDLLFTTRTIFKPHHYDALKEIIKIQKNARTQLYACISITRYAEKAAYIEPFPIPSPNERIEALKQLKKIGATTVVALRPFLPVVEVDDYLSILKSTQGFVDIALGEPFYFIRGGKVCKRVFPEGIPEPIEESVIKGVRMYFDDNNLEWDVWNSSTYEKVIREYCEQHDIIFSMHSEEALEKYKSRIACTT